MMQALARGGQVKVAGFTNGDGFPAAAAGLTNKPVTELATEDFFAISRFRQMQMRTAMLTLGGKPDDVILLGYPDSMLGALYAETEDKPRRRRYFGRLPV
jgi:hypothetical protein